MSFKSREKKRRRKIATAHARGKTDRHYLPPVSRHCSCNACGTSLRAGRDDCAYCSFGVQGQPDENARRAITEFSDGRSQTIRHAQTTLTNPGTGDSFVQVSRYKETQTPDPEANEVLVETSGRFFIGFEEWEADKGPLGEIGEDGMLASVIGHEQYTLHPDTGVITSYSLDGRATDICALLSG